jgi:hypothetical protein
MYNISKIDAQITALEKIAASKEKECLEELWRKYEE